MYYIKASRNEKMRLLNRVVTRTNEGAGWMGEEKGILECMGWSGQVLTGKVFEDLSLSQVNEMLEACVLSKLRDK